MAIEGLGPVGEESAQVGGAACAALPLESSRPPMRVDEGGVVRIGNSRVSLDVIVDQYELGMTPEALVRAYDTLALADVYAAIAYYLRHRDVVRNYLQQRARDSEIQRAKIEAERSRITREDLAQRRSARETEHAPPGQ
jgi:uncharacterized protein (DUF433 family)